MSFILALNHEHASTLFSDHNTNCNLYRYNLHPTIYTILLNRNILVKQFP